MPSPTHALSLLALPVLTLAATAADFSCDFTSAPDPADIVIVQAGTGVATTDADGLLLDLRSPQKDKAAWAELKPWFKLPVTVEWEQQLVHDSAHCYPTGLLVRDVAGHPVIAGLSGQPMGRLALLGGRRGDAALEPGRWYRLKLEIPRDRRAVLTVTDRDNGTAVSRLEESVASLQGAFVSFAFYHNQSPVDGPDKYADDRGAVRFAKLRITAGAIHRGAPETFRDAELRGYDVHTPMTFNRATVWLGAEQGIKGTVLAFDRAAELPLTGEKQVAAWNPNRLCEVRNVDAVTSAFVRPNDLNGDDSAALRIFQWNARQHPTLEYELRPTAGPSWFKVTLFCANLDDGIELFRSEPSTEAQRGSVDLLPLIERRGMEFHQFHEIGLFVYQGQAPDRTARDSRLDFSLKLTGPGALVATPPLIRTAESARGGVDVYALYAGPDGEPLHTDAVRITANCAGQDIELAEIAQTGVFGASLKGLPVGEHTVALTGTTATGAVSTWPLQLSITDGDFASWSREYPTYQLKSGRVLPTLAGDLFAWVPMLDAKSENRRVIATADAWRALTPEEQTRVRLIKHRTVSRAEIATMLEAYRDNGVRAIRLASNVSPVEAYLDAGGHVSMHGLETLCLTLAECRRLGIRALINVFHYPYLYAGTGNYPPWDRYTGAGYRDYKSFTTPEMDLLERQYLAELLAILRDDPAVLGYTITGENDPAYGAAWLNGMFEFVRACDPNHLVTLEQAGGAQSCQGRQPWGYDEFACRTSGGLGYRTYYTEKMKSDAYFMVCGRFYRANPPVFLAEVASGPGWYHSFKIDWLHPDFNGKLRDNSWASLLCQQTLCLSWSAPWSQPEHRIPELCARQLDWNRFHRRQPPVAIRLKEADRDVIRRLADIESALARQGLDSEYLWEGRAALWPAESFRFVIDARTAAPVPEIPSDVLAERPVVASGEYSVNYLWSEAPTQLLAYIKNTAEYQLAPGYGNNVNELHRQRTKPSRLTLSLPRLPAGCRWRLYDVDERRLVKDGTATDQPVAIELGDTAHDYALVASELPLP
ncbi:MAG: hypothetical protein A3K19_32785 [Lentisphaerae bacterium RIFOXYB12_FULL_65_16]|nr:MAG: hypothetical protein A3K18_28140 [Lentisphaerae bacterium RIFOXYA12_64_32]OGV84520.1 MAG: hypothetical protein A3K19_32785 [Lentisphaerae bacterium RIFOXYB12_FULL_65_16]